MLNLNYTHLLTAEDRDGVELKRRAKDDFNIALDYYGIDNLHLGVDAQYIGSRTDTDSSFEDVETGEYALVNLTASYDIGKNLKVYAKVENVTDEYYQTVYGYSSSPRAFYAGLRGEF
jgi:vitamin B12 transporter